MASKNTETIFIVLYSKTSLWFES